MADCCKAGRITRLKVKGFMTYDDLEISPNKGLNLIIGLNGSGKSSIMSAICLGLGGKPQYTGKSAQPSDFVKLNHNKATIEIELEEPKGKNIVITRTIHGDKSSYLVNGYPSSQADVMVVVKKFNIDVGNLCQFLPQEKVAEFSKMDKKQRLENMLQAIGEPQMYTTFGELKQMRVDCNELEQQLADMEDDKANEEQTNSRLRVEVEKHEERKRLQDELKNMNLRKTAMEYVQARNDVKNLKAEKNRILKQKQKLQQEMNELEKEISNTTSERDGCLRQIRNKKTRIEALNEKLTKNSNDMIELHDKVHLAKIDFNNMMTEKFNQKSKLEELDKQIKGLRTQCDQLEGDQENITVQIEDNYENTKELRRQFSELDRHIEKIRPEINRYEYTLKSLQGVVARLKNEENKKMQILRQRSLPTYDAVRWLKENRSGFKSTICNPVLLSIKVEDDSYSKFIENTIAFRDLISFVCEDKEDMKKLSRILIVEKKLKINVALAPSARLDSFRSPQVTPQLRQLGLQCFLKDLFTAPDPVMCYLCQINSIHTIPICNANADRNIDALLKNFWLFFTPTERIQGKRSKYGAKYLSVKRDPIGGKNILLSAKDQSEEILQNEAEIRDSEEKVAELKRAESELSGKRSVLERKQEQLRAEKVHLKEKENRLSSIKLALRQKRDLYKRKEAEVIDEREEKAKERERICHLNKEKMSILVDIYSILKEYHTLMLEKVKQIPLSRIMNRKVKDLTDKLRSWKADYETVEREYLEKSRTADQAKTIAQRYYEEVSKIDKEFLNQMLSQVTSLEEVQAKIVNIEAQLELSCGANDEAVAEYEIRQRKILNAKKSIEGLEKQIANFQAAIDQKKAPWLDRLEMHINNINVKFTQYYKFLKCAGEISLDKSEDPNNFLKYGLQIRLKYRVGEDFMELSQTHHSGGECSVAAIIFILSLQELTNVPFRCIDEINQGMDAINERKIYQLIADASKSGSCSQYFLLTPKLLMDLNYHEDVKVHIIFNSHYLNMKFKLKDHLRAFASN